MSSLAQCEALAADPARYVFKLHLGHLKAATSYDSQHLEIVRLGGYLSCLLECDVIPSSTHGALLDELHAFVWGADA